MTTSLTSVLALIQEKLDALQAERLGVASRLREIDKQIADIAKRLGVEAVWADDPQPAPDRLPGTKMIEGTMPEKMMSVLFDATRGLTRTELKQEICKDPTLAARIGFNPNSFYNTVGRYLKKGLIIDIDGHIYHKDRAPISEEEGASNHTPVVRLVPSQRMIDL